jgi:transposase-like protein
VERKRGQRYRTEFRREAVERMPGCNNIVRLERELGVCRRVLYNWRDRLMRLTASFLAPEPWWCVHATRPHKHFGVSPDSNP